ncbi:hypothetical protein ACJVC5_00300 [Peredibacter sp. HCB2-198]|uniref:hypothetical protein n=1 Tax=Peredibacter sp. HCB2-198 TaxID=3383025 RepID=UPI0038B5405B
MKYLVLLVLGACASYHPQFNVQKGMPYKSFAEEFGGHGECVNISTHKFCKWEFKTSIYHFQNDAFESRVEFPTDSQGYQVNSQCRSSEEKFKKVFVESGNRNLSMKSLDWKMTYPQIEKVLKLAGLELADKSTTKQGLKLNFGLEETVKNNARRFLNISGENNGEEVWSSSVSSIGESHDFDRILPILLVASYDCIEQPTNRTISKVINEKDLSVVAMKHLLEKQ